MGWSWKIFDGFLPNSKLSESRSTAFEILDPTLPRNSKASIGNSITEFRNSQPSTASTSINSAIQPNPQPRCFFQLWQQRTIQTTSQVLTWKMASISSEIRH
ncbi:hypothetical protein O181_050522 [Austropuccinia psidii MF-1]|uniref:Uncharacterized protein n=1 Tax=Austropuccinia psidii MF-1 TaxID=1389203 RepID=A0A9Q3HNN8_9BASI|nr:hypothetical protein [Austropuccinia psidii MF-1]